MVVQNALQNSLRHRGTRFAITSAVTNLEPKSTAASPATFRPSRPVHDEWGLYDPAQAGFEAVLRRLDAISQDESTASATPLHAAPLTRWPALATR